MVALVLDGLVGFPAGLSPTSFHLSPSSFHLSPRVGACGRVPGWLVSHFLSYVSRFFSFPKQFTVTGSQCFKEPQATRLGRQMKGKETSEKK